MQVKNSAGSCNMHWCSAVIFRYDGQVVGFLGTGRVHGTEKKHGTSTRYQVLASEHVIACASSHV